MTALAVSWNTFLNCRIFKREEQVDGRQEHISKALCSSLAVEVCDVPNKGNFLCTSNECGWVFAWFDPHQCAVTEHGRRGGVNLLSRVFPELLRCQVAPQTLIPPANTRLAAGKGRSGFRGRLLTHTNSVI